jgi:hypothetical protein
MDGNIGLKDDSGKKRPSKGLRACWECEEIRSYRDEVIVVAKLTALKVKSERHTEI